MYRHFSMSEPQKHLKMQGFANSFRKTGSEKVHDGLFQKPARREA
jgi:hypothetical protein